MRSLGLLAMFLVFSCSKPETSASLMDSSSARPVPPSFLPVIDGGIAAPYSIKDGGGIYVRAGAMLKKLIDSNSASLSSDQLANAQRVQKRFDSLKKYVVDGNNTFIGLVDFKYKNDKRLADANFLKFEINVLAAPLKQFSVHDQAMVALEVDIMVWNDDHGIFDIDNATKLGEDYSKYKAQEADIVNWVDETLVPWMLAN